MKTRSLMKIKFSGIFYFSKDFSILETKIQYVDIAISNIPESV